ncbi:MAG TPA: hypothetical protein VHC72_04615 [Bryobacteraceae bacterium]|nr:hypothetical protein [Bryobacteraceae bacterium]HWB86190.1 hypothetical protein [Bryobacteraceae bacterium]
MRSKTTLKLDKSLCQRAAAFTERAGYSSLEEFVEHAIEKELARMEKPESAEDIARKLKGLGYLE